MAWYDLLKFAHILGAVVILGTGTGIAFFMLMAHRTGDPAHIAATAETVVVADLLFTASAVVLQPATGFGLARMTGVPLVEPWVAISLGLYVVTGLFWLPVVRMQVEMRDLARRAAQARTALPARYHRLFRLWFLFGFPGFGSVMAILWLMISKPGL